MGDKTFLLDDNVWVDTTFDGTRMVAEAVAFGGARYFRLLAERPVAPLMWPWVTG